MPAVALLAFSVDEPLVKLTAQVDHQHLMDLLHITTVRKGADPRSHVCEYWLTAGGRCIVSVIGAALSPGLAGVYQIAIQVPSAVATGRRSSESHNCGFSTPDNVQIYVAPN